MRTTGVSRYHLNSPLKAERSVADGFISLRCNGAHPWRSTYRWSEFGDCEPAFFASISDDFGAVSLRRLPPCVSFSIRFRYAYSF